MNRNYYTIFGLRLLKSIITIFIDAFFVLYFLTISNDNLFSLSIYYIIVYISVFLSIFFVKNICKTEARIYLFRIGIVLNFIYFLTIYILQEKMLNYLWLIGILYGLEEGFYYSVYNNFESTGIDNDKRQSFLGFYTMLSSLFKVIIPLIFGSVMSQSGFGFCIIIVLFLVFLQLICSVIYKDNMVPKQMPRVSLKKFIRVIKKNSILPKIYRLAFFNGLIYSGAFNTIITIYIIGAVNGSLELGVFNSIFAIITSLLGLYFAKMVKPSKYKLNIIMAIIFTIFGIVLLLIRCNFITVVLFNLFQVYSRTIIHSIYEKFLFNISNSEQIKSKYTVEYFVLIEASLFIGRFIGYILIILLTICHTIIGSGIILSIFGIMIIMFGYYLIQLNNKCMLENNNL